MVEEGGWLGKGGAVDKIFEKFLGKEKEPEPSPEPEEKLLPTKPTKEKKDLKKIEKKKQEIDEKTLVERIPLILWYIFLLFTFGWVFVIINELWKRHKSNKEKEEEEKPKQD